MIISIFFCGMTFNILYNYCAAILRAAGDTKSPLVFLSISGVVNVGLNVLFVTVIRMDVAGVALATVISQAVSAALVLFVLSRRTDACKLYLRKLRISKPHLLKIIRIGLPAGIQSSLFAISNTVIQSSVNSFGEICMSGAAAAGSIDAYVYTSTSAFGQTAVNFVGQNYGAKQFDRVIKVMKLTVVCATAVTTTAFLVGEFAPELIVRCFTDNAELTALSVNGMRIMVLAFPIVGFQMVVANFFQSIGQAQKSVLLSSMRQLLMLIPLLLILPDYFGLDGVWWSMPVSDFLSTVVAAVLLAYQFKSFKKGEVK